MPLLRRSSLLVCAGALTLALAACSVPWDASSTAAPADTASSSVAGAGSRTAADWARAEKNPPKALGDDYPDVEWNQPLPDDVTDAQLQRWIEQGDLPIAPLHGGAVETMINALTTTTPKPDVILFGDSMTQQGIDPQSLSQALSAAAGRDVTVFNAASSRARWGINEMMARYLVTIDRVPDVAIFSISTRAAEGDLFYRESASKSPFSSVVEGCDREMSDTWTEADAAECRRNVEDLRYRFRSGGGQVARAQAGEPLQTSLYIRHGSMLRSDGFMIHPSISAAEAEEVSRTRMERGFPGYPSVHEEAVRDFGEAATILRAHGATVLATEIPYSPVHQANLEKAGPGYDARRQEAAAQLAGRNDVPLFPVQRFGDWWGDGDSRDAIHLAPHGAWKFAQQLVNDTPGFREAVIKGLKD